MLARFRRGEHLPVMQIIGGRDIDRIDMAEEFVERSRRQRDIVLGRIGGAARGVGAHHAGDFAFLGADRRDHPFARDRRRADQTPTHRLGHDAFLPRQAAPQLSRTMSLV